MHDVIIIDPASTEFNRGSFCYLPYIYFSALKAMGYDVLLLENFTAGEIDEIPSAKEYCVALWSYPQIDLAIVLHRFLPEIPVFFGYYPLIRSLKLPILEVKDDLIYLGIRYYHRYYHTFQQILLSDCDMHLKKYGGQVYPLFTSYGCPNGCTFCPSTVNCGKTRVVLSEDRVRQNLISCSKLGMKNIHFTDEDFFFDSGRANRILSSMVGKGMKFISLGSAVNVKRFVEKYGESILVDSGMKLIEIGLESAEESLTRSMSKTGLKSCVWLGDNLTVPIFWLTMTFYPGETIGSLNKTGKFLEKYGMQIKELYGRVQTNGTKGGLGQFFQAYHGTKIYEEICQLGFDISSRPIRLIPSFIPYSFFHDVVKKVRVIRKSERQWFDLYRLPVDLLQPIVGQTIANHFEDNKLLSHRDIATFLAVCARLGVIQ